MRAVAGEFLAAGLCVVPAQKDKRPRGLQMIIRLAEGPHRGLAFEMTKRLADMQDRLKKLSPGCCEAHALRRVLRYYGKAVS